MRPFARFFSDSTGFRSPMVSVCLVLEAAFQGVGGRVALEIWPDYGEWRVWALTF